MIRFLYENEIIELDDVEADLTVLDWLRLHRNRTGTKEGCGSGDCGACTVVTVSAVDDENSEPQLSYQSINSCISFVGALHGKQLLSVESLEKNNELHPVQQAMVDEHGSQCGFCTPGFVMSMYALYQQTEKTEDLVSRVDQALGGNLCRCTGYRPIKAAAVVALQNKPSLTSSDAANDVLFKQLQLLSSKPMGNVEGFVQPTSIAELAAHYQQNPNSRLLAGGTDLALEVTQQMKILPQLLHVSRVPEMRLQVVQSDHLILGAAVTLSECLKLFRDCLPAAQNMLLRFGSDQVRNCATIGGNLGSASPIGDLPPLLLALDATLTLQLGEQTRSIGIQDYYLGYRETCLQPGEFIRQVHIPLPKADAIVAVYKISKRTEDDISSVCLALHLPQEGGVVKHSRLAFGGMAATPVRAFKAEHALDEQAFNQASVVRAQEQLDIELQPISDARASAAYRKQIAQNLLQRALLEQGHHDS